VPLTRRPYHGGEGDPAGRFTFLAETNFFVSLVNGSPCLVRKMRKS